MECILLVIRGCRTCERALAVWLDAAGPSGWSIREEDIASGAGAVLARELGVKTVPSLLFDDRVVAVGIPSPDVAATLLRDLSAPSS